MIDFDWRALLPQAASGLAILVVGVMISGIVARLVGRGMRRARVDEGLTGFVRSLTRSGLVVLSVVIAASTAGIEMTSFVAILGAAGLAIGLAFQGSLSNFAGGILVLTTRPFTVGDFIEAAGHMGTVREVLVLYTVLDTPDNRRVVIPNGTLANASIINYSVNENRRVDLSLGISYDADIGQAVDAIAAVISANPLVLHEPEPLVGVSGHGDSSINLLARFWTPREHFLTVQHQLYREIKERLDAEGISIPFPQREVRVLS